MIWLLFLAAVQASVTFMGLEAGHGAAPDSSVATWDDLHMSQACQLPTERKGCKAP